MEFDDAAIQAVSAPGHLSEFSEHGFRTVDKGRVLASLTRAGLDPDAALVAAHAAIESLGGFVTNAERNAGLGGPRSAWRYLYEVWMVPENVSSTRAA
jgi:anaerobic glycerol-3-phosphate dehydrogenase